MNNFKPTAAYERLLKFFNKCTKQMQTAADTNDIIATEKPKKSPTETKMYI